jgi:hypothetical protein
MAVLPDHLFAPWFVIEQHETILPVISQFLVHALHGFLDEGHEGSQNSRAVFRD